MAHSARIVRAFLVEARGHPAISWWEEGFLASLADQLHRHPAYLRLSDKQAAIILKIEDKIRAAGLAQESEDTDDLRDWA